MDRTGPKLAALPGSEKSAAKERSDVGDETQKLALDALRQALESVQAAHSADRLALERERHARAAEHTLLLRAHEARVAEEQNFRAERAQRDAELKTTLEALKETTRLLSTAGLASNQRGASRPWGQPLLMPRLRAPRILGKTARFEVTPRNDVRAVSVEGFNWLSTGSDPAFDLVLSGQFPGGWVLVDFEVRGGKDFRFIPHLYFDDGGGYSERSCIKLSRPLQGRVRAVVKLPEQVRGLRFDPSDHPGFFFLGKLTVHELTWPGAAARLSMPALTALANDPGRIPDVLKDVARVWREGGLEAVKDKLNLNINTKIRVPGHDYAEWVEQYDTLEEFDREAIRGRIKGLARKPLISVVMPVYNTPQRWLRAAIESVQAQLYENWELCIADDASTKPHVRKMLEAYARKDRRIKLTFRKKNGHISATSNSALALATGEFVALLDHDDEIREHALYMVAEAINANPEVDLIYSDEDKIDEQGVRSHPHFKPEWNPDLFYSQNFFSHLGVFRRSLVEAVGGFKEGCEGSQDYDLCLRCVGETKPSRIVHIPHVLYHWRALEGSTALNPKEKEYTSKAGAAALKQHFETLGLACTASVAERPNTYRVRYPLPAKPPLVSIIIPTRDGHDILRQCITSIREKTTYPSYEILIVDNQSKDPKTLAYFRLLQSSGHARVLPYKHAFNYSAINNFAVGEARGEVIALVNNDIEVISPGWLDEMVSHALRPEIGAVGAKLYYPNDNVQHAGVIIGLGGVAGHSHKYFQRDAPGYFTRPHLLQGVTAVTAACLVIRKSIWDELGGLEAKHLAVAFNDVDFCLRVGAAGYRNLLTPYAELYHHESLTRGAEDTPAKIARFQKEIDYMKRRWGKTLSEDPAYSPNLTHGSEDFALAWPPRVRRPWMPVSTTPESP